MEQHTDGTALRVRASHCQFQLGMTQDFQATDGKNQLDFKTDDFLNEMKALKMLLMQNH